MTNTLACTDVSEFVQQGLVEQLLSIFWKSQAYGDLLVSDNKIVLLHATTAIMLSP